MRYLTTAWYKTATCIDFVVDADNEEEAKKKAEEYFFRYNDICILDYKMPNKELINIEVKNCER